MTANEDKPIQSIPLSRVVRPFEGKHVWHLASAVAAEEGPGGARIFTWTRLVGIPHEAKGEEDPDLFSLSLELRLDEDGSWDAHLLGPGNHRAQVLHAGPRTGDGIDKLLPSAFERAETLITEWMGGQLL